MWAILLFSGCLAFFLERGPYRAIRYSTTGDFSTVYAAARAWSSGANPYDRDALKKILAEAGAPPDLERDQDVNPSVYLPSALPLAAVVASLRWRAANLVWCLLSLALFAASVAKLIAHAPLTSKWKWLAGGAALIFSPTYVGFYDGNPSVISISLVTLALALAIERSPKLAGILLGLALCLKPQIAVCGLCVLVLWRSWSPLFIACLIFCLSTLAGVLVLSGLGQHWAWWQSEQHNIAMSFTSGGPSDPSPTSAVAWQLLNTQTLTSYVIRNRHASDIVVWSVAALLTSFFLYARSLRRESSPWLDVAFCAVLAIVVSYHRYYDAQLFLVLIPLLARYWKAERYGLVLAVGTPMLALAFPVQSVFERWLGPEALVPSFKQLLLLRVQPMAVLALAFGLLLNRNRSREETET